VKRYVLFDWKRGFYAGLERGKYTYSKDINYADVFGEEEAKRTIWLSRFK
jgi:hypothetical protein